MRILSLGAALPDALVDNYDWASALSFYDYDAIVVDPAASVSRLINGVVKRGDTFVTYTDDPVGPGATTDDTVGLVELLKRRREETAQLLARGGLVVVFTYPDVAHPEVAGFTGCHRYYWLPAPEGHDYGPKYLKPANGIHVETSDFEHPFADYLERVRNNVLYRASITEGAAGFGEASRVIGRSPGGAAIAVELSIGGGKVVFLPALPPRMGDMDRGSVAHSIVAAIRNTLLMTAEGDPPLWLDDYPLPGIVEAQEKLDTAEARLETAEAEAEEARNTYRDIARFRRLLWQEGKYGYDLPVRDALTKLGMINFSSPDDPAVFLYDTDHLFLETESSLGAVGMEPHYRLRQRLENRIATEGKRAFGLIVVNGWRGRPPTEREQQYEDSLRVAAESMRYSVVEASRLFEAVRDKMEGKNTDDFLRRLVNTEGAYSDGAEIPVKE